MHSSRERRYLTLHVHLDSTNGVHWFINNQHDIRDMFTERQLLDQQYSTRL